MPETKRESGIPALERQISPEIRRLFEIVKEFSPELNSVKFDTFSPKNDYDVGGYYGLVSGDGQKIEPAIFLSDGPAQSLTPLLKIRKESVRINAELIGIKPEEMTPELLQLFIIAHELGHLNDFLKNYKADPDLVGMDAVDEMYFHRDSILSQLPIPNLSPTHLAEELKDKNSLAAVVTEYPDVVRHPKFDTIETVEDLLRLQEREYRESEPERYADNFAAELLKKYSERFGLPLNKTVNVYKKAA